MDRLTREQLYDLCCRVCKGDQWALTELEQSLSQEAVREEGVQEIMDEVQRATNKFPTWPTDPLHAVAVLGEEFGELTKAMLQLTYEPGKTSKEEVRKEALQTAAMAYRLYASIDRYDYKQGQQHEQPALKREPNAAGQGSPKEHTAGTPTDTAPAPAALQFRTEDCPTYDASVTPTPAAPDVASMVKRLEDYYDFQCEGGPLKNCVEWIKVKEALLAWLGQIVSDPTNKPGMTGEFPPTTQGQR